MLLRRKLASLASFAAVMLVASACQAASSVDPTDVPSDYVMEMADEADMPEEILEIRERGRLVIGARFDQPLTGMRDDATGRIEGFDAEIGRILAQRIFGYVAEGENLDFIETVAGNRETYLQEGVADMVVATYTITDERKELVDFAGPYYEAGQSIMTLRGEEISDVDDLAGRRVCAATGSTSAATIEQLAPQADLSPMRDYSSCVEALRSGTVDAVSTDNVILYGFSKQWPEEFSVSENLFTSEPYGIGLPHGSPELREFVNATLEEAYSNGDWNRAFSRTLETAGAPAPEEHPKIVRY
ncbi:glutamate transport system substrate-binding protein [Stackebrandtia albiflava]|uniref:Glutamate transport system substrate-binding protein n=1 Tax=Stackebrandtia albiflava TaxID=406432 RepID=A0A562UQI5_9ACTN|nr:glutamate ABC transporter substrate-binding protein [Stackebrandtia albiflava]TWJ07868.1 glutamate transport system substrate-binding protein [Stackebrandtia albiflava]